MKNKYTTIGIILTTLVLAGVAIFTAIRLYQTRNTAVAPNVPSSKPAAAGAACSLSFTLAVSTPTATATATSTATSTATATATSSATATATSSSTATATSISSSSPTATATATVTASPNPQCNNSCTNNSNCPSGLMCYITSGTTGSCRNTQCLTETDCTCAVTTTAPTTQPTLPVVGTSWPTVLGTGFGMMVIIGSLLLAL